MKAILGIAILLLLAGCSAPAAKPSPSATAEPKYAVIDVRGETVANAQLDLTNLGFSNIALHPVGAGTPDDTWTVKDEANVGAKVSRFATIDLTVYLKNIPVPDLTNLTVTDATAALKNLGLLLVANANAAPDWLIQTQSIAAGTMAGATDVVTAQATEPPQFDTYTVTGNGTAFAITYATGGTGSSQATNVRLPWSTQIPTGSGFLYVSAQDGSGSTITCAITGPGGDVIATNTATGRYAIATCSS